MLPLRTLFLFPALLILAGCEAPEAVVDNGKTLTIGVLAPLSGEFAARGEQGVIGSELASQIQPRLQDGTRIRLRVRDSAGGSKTEIFKQLAENPQVIAILDLSTSLPVIEIAKIADKHAIPVLATIATHPDVTAYGSWVSQLCLDDKFQGTVAALYVSDELLLDRVAVFSNPMNAHSRFVAGEFIRKFRSVGGTVTDEVHLSGTELPDWQELERIRDGDPELLYFALTTSKILAILERTGRIDWYPEIMGTDGFLANVLSRHPAQLGLVQGMLATDFFSENADLSAWGDRFIEAFHASQEGEATTFALLGAEGYQLLVEAANRCADPAVRACINREIRATSNLPGIMGKITIDETGKAHRALFVNSIRDGTMYFVVRVY